MPKKESGLCSLAANKRDSAASAEKSWDKIGKDFIDMSSLSPAVLASNGYSDQVR